MPNKSARAVSDFADTRDAAAEPSRAGDLNRRRDGFGLGCCAPAQPGYVREVSGGDARPSRTIRAPGQLGVDRNVGRPGEAHMGYSCLARREPHYRPLVTTWAEMAREAKRSREPVLLKTTSDRPARGARGVYCDRPGLDHASRASMPVALGLCLRSDRESVARTGALRSRGAISLGRAGAWRRTRLRQRPQPGGVRVVPRDIWCHPARASHFAIGATVAAALNIWGEPPRARVSEKRRRRAYIPRSCADGRHTGAVATLLAMGGIGYLAMGMRR